MKNRYEIRGAEATVFLERQDGSVIECLVDTEDLEKIADYKWCLGTKSYVQSRTSRKVTNGKQRTVHLHRLIMDPPPTAEVDHRNQNPLDNRKHNLRVATVAENQQNRGHSSNNTSGYRGVSWDKHGQTWEARVQIKGNRVRVGTFSSPEAAAKAASEYRARNMPFSPEAMKTEAT